MYKVFFKQSSFLLTDDKILLRNNDFIHHYDTKDKLQSFISEWLRKKAIFNVVIYNKDIELLLSAFLDLFTYVEAAGGAVINENNLLLIERMGIYDLPKGHIEPGETPEECAVREVEEECGITGLNITGQESATYHIYRMNEKLCVKKTYWFRMECTSGQTPTPQQEEGIDRAFWHPLNLLSSITSNTYASLKELFKNITA